MQHLESPNDAILQEDLNYIANSDIPLNDLRNSTILVTGATGLIGSQIIKALLCCNRIKGTNINVLALVRDEIKVKKLYDNLLDCENLSFIYSDIVNPIRIEQPIDYIIHGASFTKSKLFVDYPVETIKVTLKGTENILELAKEKNVKGVVYLSSMEAFGITDPSLNLVEESDLGYIDILNTRSCYSEGKRMSECMCASYSSEFKIPVTIARLAQTFGSGITLSENRVFAQFAKSVIKGSDIILHTDGESVGNYVYTRDAVIAILMLLVNGERGEAYIVSNEESNTTIKDMAYMVANEIAHGRIKVIFDIPEDENKLGYAPKVNMKLSSKKLRKLGWKPSVGLKDSYIRLINSMLNIMN